MHGLDQKCCWLIRLQDFRALISQLLQLLQSYCSYKVDFFHAATHLQMLQIDVILGGHGQANPGMVKETFKT